VSRHTECADRSPGVSRRLPVICSRCAFPPWHMAQLRGCDGGWPPRIPGNASPTCMSNTAPLPDGPVATRHLIV
jgi:hypothetical protein